MSEQPVSNAPNYSAWHLEPLTLEGTTKKDIYLNLIGWAVLAPNTHNVQPWRFVINLAEDCIEVCLPRSGVLPVSDKDARQAHISIGCCIANLLSAAEYYGLNARLEYCASAYHPSPLVKIRLSGLPNVIESRRDHLEAMRERRMNRVEFNPQRLVPAEVLEKMHSVATSRGLVLDVISDNPTRFAIAEIQYTADRAVVARTDFRNELASFLLPNDTSSSVGMPGSTFSLSDGMALRIHEELKKAGVFDPDLAVGMAASSRNGIKSAPIIGVISVGDDHSTQWLKAGMAFEEMALIAEIHGLSIAVHAAIVEVGMLNRLLRMRLGRMERPVVIFRMGYVDGATRSPHSPRLSVAEVTEIRE